MDPPWIESGRRALMASFVAGGWPYRRGQPTAVEATAAPRPSGSSPRAGGRGRRLAPRSPRRAVADRLASLQRMDGSLGPTACGPVARLGDPLSRCSSGGPSARTPRRPPTCPRLAPRRAGRPARRDRPTPTEFSAHDTSIRGWPWVEGTHSCGSRADGPGAARPRRRRVRGSSSDRQEARDLLRDRKLAAGGWNAHGNTVVFGSASCACDPSRCHRASPCLALAAAAGEERTFARTVAGRIPAREELPGLRAGEFARMGGCWDWGPESVVLPSPASGWPRSGAGRPWDGMMPPPGSACSCSRRAAPTLRS